MCSLHSKRTERYESVKVQFILEQAMKAQRESRKYSPNLSFISAVEWGGSSMLHPSCFTPRNENQNPLYRRLGGPQGWSRWVQKILPPPRFDPQTVQAKMKGINLFIAIHKLTNHMHLILYKTVPWRLCC